MNREQMIAWLTLEGWTFHAENDTYYPAMRRDEVGYPLHITHNGFRWTGRNDKHKPSNWGEAKDCELHMAMLNLGVAE